MRVALLQISLNGGSQSANLQHVLGAIDRAAGATPPPDVLVLPGACDTGGEDATGSLSARVAEGRQALAGKPPVAPNDPPVAPNQGTTPAQRACFLESVASKACEWGVFVAIGIHTQEQDAVLPTAVLIDPDGDVVVSAIAASDAAAGRDDRQELIRTASASDRPQAAQARKPASGWITVREPESGRSPMWADMPTDILVALPTGPGVGVDSLRAVWVRRDDDTAAKNAQRYIAIVRAAIPGAAGKKGSARSADRGGSVLLDARGSVLCRASAADEDIVFAEVFPR